MKIPNQCWKQRPDLSNDVTTTYLLWNVISPCVAFLPTEGAITHRAIMYECLQSFCLPATPTILSPEYIHKHEIAYVDGLFLYHFLLYVNHVKLSQRDSSLIDILLMKTDVSTRNLSHKAACFNILGWVYKQEGLMLETFECFKESIQKKAGRNAAYWHLCFLICEQMYEKSSR